MEKAKTLKKRKGLSTEISINRDSALNSLQHFHILSGLPPDVFHDIMEGNLLKTLQLLLAHFLLGESKVMTVQVFNDKLVEFDYGYFETKPSMILPQHLKDGANLQETGMQIWYLSLFVPFILGPHIDPENEFWKNYLLILEITSLACDYEISATILGYLENIVDEYLTTFRIIYDTHLTPKQHFLTHYPSLFRKFGPLYAYNTLRYEAKHQVLKDFMRKTKCFKNPSL